MDIVRVGVSDPSYQCQAVSADSSMEEAAAAAQLDTGAVAQRSAILCKGMPRFEEFKEGGQLMTPAGDYVA